MLTLMLFLLPFFLKCTMTEWKTCNLCTLPITITFTSIIYRYLLPGGMLLGHLDPSLGWRRHLHHLWQGLNHHWFFITTKARNHQLLHSTPIRYKIQCNPFTPPFFLCTNLLIFIGLLALQ